MGNQPVSLALAVFSGQSACAFPRKEIKGIAWGASGNRGLTGWGGPQGKRRHGCAAWEVLVLACWGLGFVLLLVCVKRQVVQFAVKPEGDAMPSRT